MAACAACACFVQQWKNKHAHCVQQSWKAVTALFPEGSRVWRVNGCQKRACIVGRTGEIRERLANDCCLQLPTTPFHLPRVAQYLWDSPSAPPLAGWNQPWQIWLSSISSVLSGETQLALCSSQSISISASALLPQLIVLLSLFLPESNTPFLFSGSPPLPRPCFLPLSLPLSPSSLLIFKSHMLPARLAQLHPANEGLFIGLRLSAAKQGLAGAEVGASSTAPARPPLPPPLLHRQLHMPVLVWPCRPEADYLSLLSLIADSSWKEPGRERARGEREPCWLVEMLLDKLGLKGLCSCCQILALH